MIQCTDCNRHFRAEETSCPFCGSPVRGPVGRAIKVLASSASMMILAACYGPSIDKYETGCLDTDGTVCDEDLDGYAELDGDCDDLNAAINPGVAEVCDDTIDNDCDTLIDLDDAEDCVVATE